MRLASAAVVLLMLTAACDGGGDDDDDDAFGGDRVVLEFADFQEDPLGDCEVVGSVFNTSGDEVCDVSIRHEAIDFDGFVIGDAVSTVTDLPPDTGADFAAPIVHNDGGPVFCDEVESIELVEFEESCG